MTIRRTMWSEHEEEAAHVHLLDAIRTNDGLWNSTLLIAVVRRAWRFLRPCDSTVSGFAGWFERRRMRLQATWRFPVPAVFVSPCDGKVGFWMLRRVCTFDPTSILRYLCDKDGGTWSR